MKSTHAGRGVRPAARGVRPAVGVMAAGKGHSKALAAEEQRQMGERLGRAQSRVEASKQRRQQRQLAEAQQDLMRQQSTQQLQQQQALAQQRIQQSQAVAGALALGDMNHSRLGHDDEGVPPAGASAGQPPHQPRPEVEQGAQAVERSSSHRLIMAQKHSMGIFQLLRMAEDARACKQVQEERVATANLAKAEKEAAAARAEKAAAAKAAGSSTADGLNHLRGPNHRRGPPAWTVTAHHPTCPLIGAAENPARLQQLLKGGEDVDKGHLQGLSKDGRHAVHTPLHEASKKPYNEAAVGVLLDAGASVDLQDRSGHTALMLAAKVGAFETLHLLLEAKADITLKHDSGKTAMDWARLFDKVDCAQLLAMAAAGQPLEAGLNPQLAAMKAAAAAAAAASEAAREAAAAAAAFQAAADAAAAADAVVEAAKQELKRATTRDRQQHLRKLDAALCRLGLGLIAHPRVGPDVPHDFYAIADMIASRIKGCTVST
jgi:hypothetical protein